MRSDIARRLRTVCSDWADPAFNELVDDVAAIEVKYRNKPM